MLTFDVLRDANKKRLPQFKNAQGGLAHRCRDGSDWSFYQWAMAVLGEMGELMEVRIQYETGLITYATYVEKAGKEFADIQTYLDIWAMRGMDGRDTAVSIHPALIFAHLLSNLGTVANDTKKLNRGDFNASEWKDRLDLPLRRLEDFIKTLRTSNGAKYEHIPEFVDPVGFNLGKETVKKFNEVSDRVGVKVKIEKGPYSDTFEHYAGFYKVVE